jgi:U32 family peptidase
MSKRFELIAPAGNMECARAAVANGADAIYFGLQKFNARMRADNFTGEDLPELITYLHERDVRAFCTFNTLIFTRELEAAQEQLLELDRAGVDVVIVQDLGLARLAQSSNLRLDVHGSTQMTITSPEGIEFVKNLGLKRVVLARETSLREMKKFPDLGISLESFVHGALCVAYSGQCLTSEALGQRSANRGECAQACRLPYELLVDGVLRELGDKRYLLSPQDLAAVAEIPELIKAGVTGFKIEGRLKSPEYVAATTRVYRKAIDEILKGETASAEREKTSYELEMAFSRGLYPGWLHGVNHQELVHARFGKKRGALAGTIREIRKDSVIVDSQCSLNPGDGIVFENPEDTEKEEGGRIYENRQGQLFFKTGHINFSRLRLGDRVWKTSDPALERQWRKTFDQDLPAKTQALHFKVSGTEGQPLRLEVSAISPPHGQPISIESEVPLQQALKRPLTEAFLREQLGRLGGTRFHLEGLDVNDLKGEVILPVSAINELRRRAVEMIGSALSVHAIEDASRLSQAGARPALSNMLASIAQRKRASGQIDGTHRLNVLCRTVEQVEAAIEVLQSGQLAGVLYLDFEDIRRYADVVRFIREKAGDLKVFLATPRIQKAGEQGFFKLIENASPDGVLVRNLGGIRYFQESDLAKVGDFSLNVANPLTAEMLIDAGLERVTVSYDLNAEQVLDLLSSAPARWFEITIHQHLPMFHMEHCVFAAFLSSGTDHTNCGRPCDHHQIRLRDRVGVAHPVKADVGCRNTVYHAKAQSGADYFSRFSEAGVREYRVELLDEDRSRTTLLLDAYRKILCNETNATGELFEGLNVVRQLGVTNGTLTVLRDA